VHNVVRLSVLAGALLATTGCGYYWSLQQSIDTGCASLTEYFLDQDDDGWGQSGTSVMLCSANQESGHTATNGRDCDDADPDVTALVGSVCPESLVTGDASFVAAGYGDSEFVAVHASGTGVVWATEAATACGPWGWGGGLATFDDLEDYDVVTSALDEVEAVYAGFVDIGWDTANARWVWLDGSTLDLASVGWCFGTEPTPEDFNAYLDPDSKTYPAEIDQIRLALVKREAGWCIGEPRQALPVGLDTGELAEFPEYTTKDAHFVCERPTPDPADYSTAGAVAQDTAL
jgi:hypothetical protein